MYIIDNIKYCDSFPREYAERHAVDTGPHECQNCASYGLNPDEEFDGYFLNCYYFDYAGQRPLGYHHRVLEAQRYEAK